MKDFFKFTLASLLGTFLAGVILFILVFVVILGSIIASASEFGKAKAYNMKENSVLHLTFDKQIVDRTNDNDLDFPLPGGFFQSGNEGLNHILANIEKAKTDKNIKGILLDIDVIPAGWASIKEIRDELVDFKKSGKWIVSYGEIYSQGAYYLASVADKIYLYPEGAMEVSGLSTNVMFMKSALDKLGIEVQVIRGSNNKFKSAVEPFIADKMSDANREQTALYLNGIWNEVLKSIAQSRKIPADSLTSWANNLTIESPEDAVKYGLVDKTLHRDELMEEIGARLNEKDIDDIRLVSLKNYKKSGIADSDEKKEKKDKGYSKEKIAIIYCSGTIESGRGSNQSIGSETTAEAIRDARLDDNVKAVVLRVNSPGGSALASDVIWREVVLTKKVKPVVVSMGDVAASGGYYIAAAASKIYAQPNTITGSIGVFGMLPNAQKLANDFGVHFDGVKTNEHADLGSIWRPLSDDEYRIIQKGVDRIYDKFLGVVADGRKMEKSMVDSIGQGRVWAGVDAKRIGLVDEIGGLEDAVKAAAKLAGLENYRILDLPALKTPFEEFVSEFTGEEIRAKYVKDQLGSNYEVYQHYKYFEEVSRMRGMQMRLPYLITFE
jgi:protease-4